MDKTGQYIYYEDYVARLIDENERHLDFLLKGFDTFKPSMGKWGDLLNINQCFISSLSTCIWYLLNSMIICD